MNNFKNQEIKKLPELPVEVWCEVLKYLPNHRELSLVSKTFYEAIKSIKYNNIVASVNCFDIKSSVEYVEEKFQNNVSLISSNCSVLEFLKVHGNRVKNLKIKKKCKFKLFLEILSIVPICESLDIASIDTDEEVNHFHESQMMENLNDLHINICDGSSDIFWKLLDFPALTELSIDFNMKSVTKICEILDKNHQIKILKLNGKGYKPNKSESTEEIFNKIITSFKNLKLESLSVDNLHWLGYIENILTGILVTQPYLTNLQFHNGGMIDFKVIGTHIKNLESLEVDAIHSNFESFSNVCFLTNLRQLIFKSKLTNGRRNFLSLFKFTSNIKNSNLQVLKFESKISLQILETLISCYPNLEIFEIGRLIVERDYYEITRDEAESRQKMLFLIRKANQSNDEKKKSLAELINAVKLRMNLFTMSDLLGFQLILIHLGLQNLKELKILSDKDYTNIEDYLEILFDANENLKSLEIYGYNASYDEETYYNRFGERFQKITSKDNILTFKKTNEIQETSLAEAVKIKNYSKYDTILKNKRIRSFKLDFGYKTVKNAKVFDKFIALIQNFGTMISKLELIGKLNGCEFTQILKSAPNCENLFLNSFDISTDLSYEVTMLKLRKLKLKKQNSFKILKLLKVSNLQTLIVGTVQWWREEEDSLRYFLKKQKKLKTFVLDIPTFNHDINDDFLILCKLENVELKYSLYLDQYYEERDYNTTKTENIITNILKGQTEIKFLDIENVSEEILQIITRDMEKLKKLKVKKIIFDYFENHIGTCTSVEILQFKDEMLNIEEIAKIFPNVKILNFLEPFLFFEKFLEAIKNFKQLENLTIKREREALLLDVKDDNFSTFINENLKELTYDCRFKKAPVDFIVKCLPNLQKIALILFDLKTKENVEETLKSHLKTLLDSSNNIEYLYYKFNKLLKIDSCELNLIEQKNNLKFLYLDGIQVENLQNIAENLKTIFQIIEIDSECSKILLVKNNQILKEVFNSNWNEDEIQANIQIRQVLGFEPTIIEVQKDFSYRYIKSCLDKEKSPSLPEFDYDSDD